MPASIPYSVHPGVAMVQRWVNALPTKTGKTIAEWADFIQSQKLKSFGERKDWLKKEYGFGGNEAAWLAEYSQGQHTWDFDPDVYLEQAQKYVDDQFAGPKHALRPIYDVVLEFALTMGKDIRICPCKTIVPIYRKRVFAELKPATRTRLELSLALDDEPITDRLVINPRAKGNDRLRHQFRLETLRDFDATVKKMLKLAYRQDADGS